MAKIDSLFKILHLKNITNSFSKSPWPFPYLCPLFKKRTWHLDISAFRQRFNEFTPIKQDLLKIHAIAYVPLGQPKTAKVLAACVVCRTSGGRFESAEEGVQGNEGVYGLQRAFKIAGAKYLVMSLWQVPDQETSVFMTTFYKHWLEGKMAIPDAFRTTQKEMRERFINPYQWAGFVLVE